VRSVRAVGLRTFAPMILKYQFIKIRSRHLYSRSRKKSPFIFTLLTLLRGNKWVFCIRLVKCFRQIVITIQFPSFHPPSTYIHSFIIIMSHMLSVNSLTFLINTLSFCYFICCDYLPSAFIFSREKATKLQMCWPFIHMFVFLLRVLVCLREE